MSKFIKSLAVISALAIFATGFTSCKNDEDNDSNTSTTNTGFEGTYYNINVINKLKTVAGENDIPYAQCSVEEVIFKKDGSGTYKIHQMEYDSEDGRQRFNLTEDFHYTKSEKTLKFTVQNDEMEFSIESKDNEDKLVCENDDREYDKGEIEEIYAYLNIESSSKTATSKVIILGKGDSANIRNLVTNFYDFQQGQTIEDEKKEATYTKSGASISFIEKLSGAETTGTLSVDEDSGKTYLKIGEEEYRKL